MEVHVSLISQFLNYFLHLLQLLFIILILFFVLFVLFINYLFGFIDWVVSLFQLAFFFGPVYSFLKLFTWDLFFVHYYAFDVRAFWNFLFAIQVDIDLWAVISTIWFLLRHWNFPFNFLIDLFWRLFNINFDPFLWEIQLFVFLLLLRLFAWVFADQPASSDALWRFRRLDERVWPLNARV